MNRPIILVHGGAGLVLEENQAACVAGCRRAALAGWAVLQSGLSAVDAVEAAVRVLEDDPVFDAGRGSYFNAEGVVQMDAILMDGHTLDLGAVAAVERVRHPITLARHVLEQSPHNLIVGRGALAFAQKMGMSLCPPEELLGIYAHDDPARAALSAAPPSDTVGAVALDSTGNMAVATSTGGISSKWPGRVGDSPLVGSGAYADNLSGAASATGEGEKLMRIVISKAACDRLAAGQPAQAVADDMIQLLADRVAGQGGIILLDTHGNVGLAHNTRAMPYAYIHTAGQVVVDMAVKHSRVWSARYA